MANKITIIGAGLTGLTLAYLLKKVGIKATILEARMRLGGRIHTIYNEGEASVEMGATWLGKKHQHLLSLLEELELTIHEQVLGNSAFYEYLSTSPTQLVQLPPNNDPSFRIKGGSSILIQHLAKTLDTDQVQLGQVVRSINFQEEGCTVQTAKGDFPSDFVISTLPPNLLVSTVHFTPELPNQLVQLAEETHTWMGESIKVALTFEKAFWQAATSSGTIMSNVGPVSEMYDHSDADNNFHALKGFMNGSFYAATLPERKNLIINQLRKYYGEKISGYSKYLECVWREESFTFASYKKAVLPHQNNGAAKYRMPFMNGRFFMAGSETAATFPGYMDGAVQSAYQVVDPLLSQLQEAT
ncbi:MAG: NAD(P)/FAD-dependent oxidoreductase [Bacteroidota bacterium]